MSEERIYNLVLEACDSTNIESITTQMSTVFPIRKEMALQLTTSTPIVILDDLTKTEANAVYTALNDVIEAGAQITTLKTDNLTSRMTKVKWPEKPKINKMSIEELATQAGEETVTKHSCPYCGGSLLVSMDEYGENISVDAEFPTNQAAPAAAPAPAPAAAGASDDFILSNDDLIAEIEEPHIPRTEEITNVLDSLLGDDPFGESADTGGGDALEPAPAAAPAPAPAAPAPDNAPGMPADRGETVGNEMLYNIFLPKLTTEDKKEKAIPLIVEFANITNDEARKLSNRIVIPLVKGIAKEKADEIKERFMSVGILPRIRQQV